jgi:hypothetical protein
MVWGVFLFSRRFQIMALIPGCIDRISEGSKQFQPFIGIPNLGDINTFRIQGYEARLASKSQGICFGVKGNNSWQGRQERYDFGQRMIWLADNNNLRWLCKTGQSAYKNYGFKVHVT